MKVGDLVRFKDGVDRRSKEGPEFAIVISIDPRPGCSMCTLLGPITGGKPLPYLMKHFEVIK